MYFWLMKNLLQHTINFYPEGTIFTGAYGWVLHYPKVLKIVVVCMVGFVYAKKLWRQRGLI